LVHDAAPEFEQMCFAIHVDAIAAAFMTFWWQSEQWRTHRKRSSRVHRAAHPFRLANCAVAITTIFNKKKHANQQCPNSFFAHDKSMRVAQ
jgi:hypothetical protein